MVPRGSADLVDALAFPLPMTVICELLGVPDIDRDTFRALSNGIVSPTPEQREGDPAGWAMSDYLVDLIADKRRSPGDDLLSALIRTRDEEATVSPPPNWSAWPSCCWSPVTRPP